MQEYKLHQTEPDRKKRYGILLISPFLWQSNRLETTYLVFPILIPVPTTHRHPVPVPCHYHFISFPLPCPLLSPTSLPHLIPLHSPILTAKALQPHPHRDLPLEHPLPEPLSRQLPRPPTPDLTPDPPAHQSVQQRAQSGLDPALIADHVVELLRRDVRRGEEVVDPRQALGGLGLVGCGFDCLVCFGEGGVEEGDV